LYLYILKYTKYILEYIIQNIIFKRVKILFKRLYKSAIEGYGVLNAKARNLYAAQCPLQNGGNVKITRLEVD